MSGHELGLRVLWPSQRVGAVRVNFLCWGMALCPDQADHILLWDGWPFTHDSKMATVKCDFT